MTSLLNNAPPPVGEPIAQPKRKEFGPNQRDPKEGLLTDTWNDWFTDNQALLEKFPGRVGIPVSLTAQAASIAATDMSGGALSGGLYRVTYYARVTQAASVSSSLEVTLDWQDGGVAITFTGAAITGNTTASYGTYTLMIHIDSASPVRYSTTYASVGLGAMNYALYVVLEEMLA